MQVGIFKALGERSGLEIKLGADLGQFGGDQRELVDEPLFTFGGRKDRRFLGANVFGLFVGDILRVGLDLAIGFGD